MRIGHPSNSNTPGELRRFGDGAFVPVCGSRIFSRNERQVEIYIGTLDEVPSGIKPGDEGWIIRRESWQHPIEGAGQHGEDVSPRR